MLFHFGKKKLFQQFFLETRRKKSESKVFMVEFPFCQRWGGEKVAVLSRKRGRHVRFDLTGGPPGKGEKGEPFSVSQIPEKKGKRKPFLNLPQAKGGRGAFLRLQKWKEGRG